jgi:mannose-6-phosphate isomerase-like protein (cupin superfamily)
MTKNKMKLNINDIGGKIAKQDIRYVVRDNTLLKNLVLSSTRLQPGYSTSGHKHPGQEEVYFFVDGIGKMYLDDVPQDVVAGDIVLIEDGIHHRVLNTHRKKPLIFNCVFDGKRTH